ncbi:hypothetical protein M8C21_015670, partial [Ambrosia artemisiifolia]
MRNLSFYKRFSNTFGAYPSLSKFLVVFAV